MKRLTLVLASSISMASFAATLTCYPARTRSPNPRPILTATIVNHSRLENVVLAPYLKNSSTGLKDCATLVGGLNVNRRSPYIGSNDFGPSLGNGDKFYLPTDLSNANLQRILADGMGRGFAKGENAVISGSAKDWSDGAGNHYSYRMRCTSDIE